MNVAVLELFIWLFLIIFSWCIIFLIKGYQRIKFYKSYWIVFSDFIFWTLTLYITLAYAIVRWRTTVSGYYLSISIFYSLVAFFFYIVSLYIIFIYMERFKGDNIFFTSIILPKKKLNIFIYIPIFNIATFLIVYLIKIIEKDKTNEKFSDMPI
ncbi:hypothetical protein [Spiroplasma endosymbiont of Aspidapion aeneum]|uniref:hypothetical protein n=1 Tax=Spiroplasma endosymbiont of Aspidapion aeneum TaxID=3066276 RepID=UPI00313BDC52